MATGRFNVKEEELVKQLGLTREEVRGLRADKLFQDEDFAKVRREICYSEAGVEKIRQILKKSAAAGVRLGDLAPIRVEAGSGAPCGAQGATEDKPKVVLDAVVTKIYTHNTQYLEALLGGQPITVRVNRNVNFLPGMVIQSRQLVMRNARQFDFVGRCPRVRGRW